jgi:hypothetical protein
MSGRLLACSRPAGFALLIVCAVALVAFFILEPGSLRAEAVPGPGKRPFTMTNADIGVDWAIDRNQELACGGDEIAGGSTSGDGAFSHLGRAVIEASAAWDIGNLIDDPQFEPEGPAGGPVAPVLGPEDYPYVFHFDPAMGECGDGPSATGEVRITGANDDEVHASIQGGEAHRLDFVVPGDGVETFTIVEITGGTGRFEDATGSFTLHTIIRFDGELGHFVIDLAEILPGGKIDY